MMAFSSNPTVREVQNGVSFAFRPFQDAVHDVAAGVASVASAIAEIDRLRVDNAALLAENERLRNENARTEGTVRENELLTGLLQLKAGFEHRTIAATVIARESSEFRRLVVLDRGTDDGIAVGDVAIVAGGALAGRVTEVGPDSAKVILLTDGEFKVIGQLSTNAATGEVIGQLGAGILVMRQIDSSETVTIGDEVVTAGIELGGGVRSPYPKGLLLGQVIDVRRDANDVVQTAYLQPAADLDRLEFVLVITSYEGGLPPIEQQPIDCNEPDGTLPQGEQPCFTPSEAPSASPAAGG
jgi:rod shape-determining protein MreC